ncbi:S-layer homology domain-containing protein [Paenibacillus riograndensis]|uniref:Putative membrane protein n=1 Tax=Paenibacillus riograndensis SBR5 TaxID=1073571 RepID=A0A0E4HD03_9BACL|nr:S-layer homology domain-containing protein [Paenibacillus riograndensis]CQR57009.1 putative membrane protein [Paenibacillus riograndensis SBR5]
MRFGRKRKFTQTVTAVCAAVILLGGLAGSGLGIGQASVSAAAVTAANPGRTDYSVSGDRLLWLEPDADGVKQVHALNQRSGANTVLTSGPSAKDAPYVHGAVAVWADKGSEPGSSLHWDIYTADLETGKKMKLNKQAGQYGNPTTDGAGVVWYERKNYGSMIYHDLATGVEADLGEGRFPVLAGGNVVYKNARDGGLSLLDVSSGVTRPLVSLGGANAVDWFVFNGSHVLYKQKNSATGSKYVLLNIKDLTAQPVDLTGMKAGGTEYAFMSIGEEQAVFQEEVDDAVTLKQVDLTTYAVKPLPIDAGVKLIGISGNKLLYSKKDDYIESVDLKENPNPTPGPETTPPPGATPNPGPDANPGPAPGTKIPVITGAKDSRIIGSSGGILSAVNGWARLEISAGTFPDNTSVSLAQAELETKELLDASGKKLLKAGSAWQVQASAPFLIPAKLAVRYPQEEPWTSKREKLGIYSYNPDKGIWSYIGGVTAAEDGFVQAKISASGLYAVMLREAQFTDISGHWAQQDVEVLAARGIVNGMNGTVFAPKAVLTRAEFTKLLTAALGLQPVHTDKPTFRDVSAAHWSYPYVEAAAAAGIVTGDAGLFHGNAPLTREQMMVMLMRAIDSTTAHSPASAADSVKLQAVLSGFKDNGTISQWARESVAAAVDKKLVQGSGQFLKPKDSSTRAEAAVIMYKLLAELKLL